MKQGRNMKKLWVLLAVLVAFQMGCSLLQVEDGVTGVADGPVGTTIVTAGNAVAGFLPPPWSTAVLVLTNLFTFVRGRRYKKITEVLVEGAAEVMGGLSESDAAVAKDTLKKVAVENNLKPEINKIVDKVKAA